MTIYLYAKQHRVTGLRYFGKTKTNPYRYKGSGTAWIEHLKIHGNDVETTWVHAYEDDNILKEEAIFFSKVYNIVKSDEWANLQVETGFDGQYNHKGELNPMYGKKRSEEWKKAHSERMKGRKQTPEQIASRVAKTTGQVRPIHSEKMKASWAKRKNT